MSDLRLYLFGSPQLEYQGTAVKLDRRKAMALLAYLAVSEPRQSREVIADLLWPELDHEHARSALRSTLRTLTTAVPVEWIQADRMLLALKHDAIWVDVNAFLGLLTASGAHAHGPDVVCDDCVTLFQQAIELYQGDFLEGFIVADSLEYDDWQRDQREWLRREYADLHRKLSEFFGDARQYDRAIKHARDWLAVDVLNEPAHRQLMRLYAANGQRSEALRQYQTCAQILDVELITTPDDETTYLYQAIHGNRLPLSPDTETTGVYAVKGIIPLRPALTVGRDAALAEIKQRLGVGGAEMRPITVIQGWPGVGKSTTVATLAHDRDIAQQFPDGVLWASMGENPSVSVELTAWADALMLSEPGRARRIEDISSQLTSALRNRRMLLIVDDVWQIEHTVPFRVGGELCALVMTSRLNDVATALAPSASDIYRLSVLSEDAALDLLAKLSPETVAAHPNEARELVRDLEGLPLAIRVAGRLLDAEARLGWGVRELLLDLRTGASLLDAQAPSDMLGAGPEPSPTVAALLKRSTNLLDPETRHRFAHLGLFVPKPATFDLDAMAVAWDVPDPRPTARTLVNRGLLEPISGGRFQVHAVLVAHARSMLEEEGWRA